MVQVRTIGGDVNKNIGKEAGKGGKARWKGVSRAKRREQGQKAAYIRWARQAIAKEQKRETSA